MEQFYNIDCLRVNRITITLMYTTITLMYTMQQFY